MAIPDPGQPEITGLACGQSRTKSSLFDLTDGSTLYFSFSGLVAMPNPGPPEMPVYAFLAPSPGPPDFPADGAPIIELGVFGFGAPNPGPPEMPLFAFASPGHLIGSVGVDVTAVPEPATLLLLGSGLAVLAGFRLRRKRH